jgi:hypothetical protein
MRMTMAALVALLCSLACASACRKTPAGPPSAPAAAPQAEGGMKAYVDPQTGKLIDHPPPGAEPLPGDVLTPTTVVEKPAPGGGVELELEGKKKDDSGR